MNSASPPAQATGTLEAGAPERPSPVRALGNAVRSPWVTTVARLALAGIFAAAALLKIGDPAESLRAVRAYRLLPEGMVKLVGYSLPFLELAVAILLLVGLATRLTAIVASVMLVLFIGAVASAWARGLHIDCGCFGGGGDVAPGATRYLSEIARDLLFLGIACLVAVRPRSRVSVDGWLTGASPAGHN